MGLGLIDKHKKRPVFYAGLVCVFCGFYWIPNILPIIATAYRIHRSAARCPGWAVAPPGWMGHTLCGCIAPDPVQGKFERLDEWSRISGPG